MKKTFMPVHLQTRNGQPTILWVDFENIGLSAPFFDQNIMENIPLLSQSFISTDVEELKKFAQEKDSYIEPNLFIFHMSKCGSTLLANILRSIENTITISEPALLGEFLSTLHFSQKVDATDFFSGVLKTYGYKRNGKEKNLVIKFPSFATRNLELITNIYPNTPRIFLYRNPVEVLVSNLSEPSQHWIYQQDLVKDNRTKIIESNSVLKNCALALKTTCELFLKHHNQNCIVINYSQLIGQNTQRKVLEAILNKSKIKISEADFDKAMGQFTKNSKTNTPNFNSDSDEKRSKASKKLTEIVERHLNPVYQQLERLRIDI